MYPACVWDISIPGHDGIRVTIGLSSWSSLRRLHFWPGFDRVTIDCLPSLLSLQTSSCG